MTTIKLKSSKTGSSQLAAALKLPKGARFYECALQVNPFAYLKRHAKQTTFKTEEDYNDAIVAACLENDIEVIGVTDHYRIDESWSLIQAARDVGIFAFAGFEAVSKDGVHFICLFDAERESKLERYIGECGVRDTSSPSPIGDKDATELMEHAATKWEASCIAAHAISEGGMLRKLSGQPRIQAWCSDHLLACAIAGPISSVPLPFKTILENKDSAHKRDRPVAVLNASDVNSPDDLADNSATTFIKMSAPSVEALRQAFLDPESRVRLSSDPEPEPHAEFLALTWEGGFLDGVAIHFNSNLNALIGGRGAGKSTVVESLRFVLGLQALTDDAKKSHDGVVKHVLQAGTKVSLLVRSHKPSEAFYTVERSVPNQPVIRDRVGNVLELSVEDILPDVQLFGQHEISELTKSQEKLTKLLERFVERVDGTDSQKATLRNKLARSQTKILGLKREARQIAERLATLPGLKETLKRYEQAGLKEKMKEHSDLVSEERLFKTVSERLDPVRDTIETLEELLPIDTDFVSTKKLEDLPNATTLAGLRKALNSANDAMESAKAALEEALKTADQAVSTVKKAWGVKRDAAQAGYEKVLRELQKTKVDGHEFIRLRHKIEELRPLADTSGKLKTDLQGQEAQRRTLLAEWQDAKDEEYQRIQAAAKSVSRKLKDRVRVSVEMSGNREPLEQLLREEVGGNLAATLERLRAKDALSLSDLAARCRERKEALQEHYGLPAGVAERLSQADPKVFMAIEELDLPATTKIELNTAQEGASPIWRALSELSTGQKATAILLLLLLEADAPLIVDQPEDDLDNRFISDGVVPIMRREKRRRQFVFSTHNANIPVLGDAELIVGMTATSEGAAIEKQHMGSLDAAPVCELVEEILEGGKTAFETRRSKYGF